MAVLERVLTFTSQARQALINDGAKIYLPTGETIQGQIEAGQKFWWVTKGYEVDGKNRLREFPSRLIEVAIYPDPERFFVSGSFDKSKPRQENLLEEDAELLRIRLGLQEINEIVPEASEVTEVMRQHFKKTGMRLLGIDLKSISSLTSIRTNTPAAESKSDSIFATVGFWHDSFGIRVAVWDASFGNKNLGIARWIVPIK